MGCLVARQDQYPDTGFLLISTMIRLIKETLWRFFLCDNTTIHLAFGSVWYMYVNSLFPKFIQVFTKSGCFLSKKWPKPRFRFRRTILKFLVCLSIHPDGNFFVITSFPNDISLCTIKIRWNNQIFSTVTPCLATVPIKGGRGAQYRHRQFNVSVSLSRSVSFYI